MYWFKTDIRLWGTGFFYGAVLSMADRLLEKLHKLYVTCTVRISCMSRVLVMRLRRQSSTTRSAALVLTWIKIET